MTGSGGKPTLVNDTADAEARQSASVISSRFRGRSRKYADWPGRSFVRAAANRQCLDEPTRSPPADSLGYVSETSAFPMR